MNVSKDLIAASATPLILSILSHGDSYGYEIIQQIYKASDGELQWAEGMIYPILHRLEKKGLIQSYWGKSETGRKRKYYRLRRSGLDRLEELRAQWKNLYGMIQNMEGGKLCST